MSPYKAELEKIRGLQSTNTYKKLTCRKYLCEKHRIQQKETAKEDTSCGKYGAMKHMVKTGISEVKPRMS